MVDSVDFVELTRKMGHDMRVPLNTIISTSEMLIQGVYDELTPKQQKSMMRVQRNNRRLLAMVDDFTTYIKASAGEIRVNVAPFNPGTQLNLWCDDIRQASEEKGLTFQLTISNNMPVMLISDESLLKRIVQALLWNALAHTSEGTISVISEWSDDSGWLLSIQDSGCGISGEDLPHIFEPFWRGQERPQLPTAGAGLGLPLSLAIARMLSGNLSLKHTETSGSTFCVQIPVEKTVSE